MRIRKLSDLKIRQIAAGEVIGRPANAIKELIENAIDAKATEITLYLANAGLKNIILVDNGLGMERQDLEICTQLHTTSKTNEDDLMFGISSFGFRGEALASIAAIADLTIESNRNKLIASENQIFPSNVEFGTRIEISDLFSNLPARLKFLKNEKVEWAHIKEVLIKYMLNYENIKWVVFHNGRKIWNLDSSSKLERLRALFDVEVSFFQNSMKDLSLSGFIFHKVPVVQYLFVNNRPVRDKGVFGFLRSVFSDYFPKADPISYVLFLSIDPLKVDCNVHPAKEEVRFFDYPSIYSLISNTFTPDFFIKKNADHLIFATAEPSFINAESRSEIAFESVSKPEKSEVLREFTLEIPKFDQFDSSEDDSFSDSLKDVFSAKSGNFIKESDLGINFGIDLSLSSSNLLVESSLDFKIIGQIRDSFVIFETKNGIGIFDQHAAHERIIYERMKSDLKKTCAQELLIPVQLHLSVEQQEALFENLDLLATYGILINLSTVSSVSDTFSDSSISGSTIFITHTPPDLRDENLQSFFQSNISKDVDFVTLINRLLADIACKLALKANTHLSHDQMESLLIEALKNPPVCNHGRPVFKYFLFSEIESWFKR